MKKRKGCMITLWIIGGFFVVISWLALRDWKDTCGLVIYKVDSTTLIGDISDSALYLTDLKGEYQQDTLIIHTYSKFVYFTFLESRKTARRGLVLERPVKFVKYDKSFKRLSVWREKDRTEFIIKNFSRQVKDR